MLKYQTIPVTPCEQKCSLVWDAVSKQAAVIDPGGDTDRLLDAVQSLGLKLEQIWITHAHVDHAAATAELAEAHGLPIHGPHPEDQFWIDGLPQAAAMYRFPPAKAFQPTRWLYDGDTVSIGAPLSRSHARSCGVLFGRDRTRFCGRRALCRQHRSHRLPQGGLRHLDPQHHPKAVAYG
jgi:glyoxylase-like metal-dependent hydrolase (beta-lactamase superfamily II)